jgi:SAM-dependent methyltransferase
MHSDEERVRFARSFDAVAEDYAAIRPHYPAALFEDLAALTTPPPARVIEIGCGPGTATGDLLGRGWRVVAVEPGERMADVARRGFAGRGLAVEVATFEQWEPAGRRFDLAFSATAFHWVDPAVRWTKTAAILRPGGHLALATNRTVGGSSFDALHRAAEELHRRLGADMGEAASPSEAELEAAVHSASSDIGVVWGVADPKGGTVPAGARFERPVVRTYVFEHAYSTDEAAMLLSTYSPYLTIPDERRAVLFAGLKEMIEQRFGGSVTRRYLSILAVSRRADTTPGGDGSEP